MNSLEKRKLYERAFVKEYDKGITIKSGMNVLHDILRKKPTYIVHALELAKSISPNSKIAINFVAKNHALYLKDETSYDGKHVKYSPSARLMLFGKQRDFLKHDLAYLKGKQAFEKREKAAILNKQMPDMPVSPDTQLHTLHKLPKEREVPEF